LKGSRSRKTISVLVQALVDSTVAMQSIAQRTSRDRGMVPPRQADLPLLLMIFRQSHAKHPVNNAQVDI
jgi:hypothetical protein